MPLSETMAPFWAKVCHSRTFGAFDAPTRSTGIFIHVSDRQADSSPVEGASRKETRAQRCLFPDPRKR